MQIHAVPECSNLHLNYITLITANNLIDLAVIIDESLKFTSHINHAVAKASVRCCLLRKCFVSFVLFKTYVRPILAYASCLLHMSPTYTTIQRQLS